jgi:hypothetical protein
MTAAATKRLLTVPPGATPAPDRAQIRRRISPEAGRAIEILGHAIEYLADEYVHRGGGSLSAQDPEIEAMQLLMALTRQIYFECPAAPTLVERLRQIWRLRLPGGAPTACAPGAKR